MSQYIIVKVNTDEEMNLRYEQDFENYDGMYVPVSDKPRYEKVGELIRCKDCKHRPKINGEYENGFSLEFPTSKCPYQCEDGYYSLMPKDDWFCQNGERKEE